MCIFKIFNKTKSEIKKNNSVSSKTTDDMKQELVTEDNMQIAEETIVPVKKENEIRESSKMKTINNKYSKVCVCLDNGHASTTPGKRSPYSMKGVKPELALEEWQFTRDIVKIVKEMLEAEGIEVFVVTPEENTDVALTTRANRANEHVKQVNKNGLFISVHADAHGVGDTWTSANGWSTFTTKGQNNSDKFADCLYDAAEEILKPLGRTIRTDKSKDGDRDWEQDFTVIVKANMPAVLTENLFYTNIKDCEFMLSEEGKNAIARVHLEGVKQYIEKYL